MLVKTIVKKSAGLQGKYLKKVNKKEIKNVKSFAI